jgi:uncharacterized membrane protein YcaP (DUF421 family)
MKLLGVTTMESILRGLVVYGFLLVVFRISGKRSLAETTSFDLVLLLIISETTQQAMVDHNHSLSNAFLLIITLVGADILLSLLKQRAPAAERWLDGVPLVIVKDGRLIQDRAARERIDENDVLEAARLQQGLETMDQIKFAVLERGGRISIIPQSEAVAR